MENKIEILESGDGSHTLYNKALDETYHSTNGAFTESMHVFINNGLALCSKREITIFEVGFGTGLNALLTYQFLKQSSSIDKINYFSIELHPLKPDLIGSLNYARMFMADDQDLYSKLHDKGWNEGVNIAEDFYLHKIKGDIILFEPDFEIDVVYFDAFGPNVQPKLWEPDVLEKIYRHSSEGGIFSTYSAKGQVRRDLQKIGYRVERRSGPPGKREMLVGFKDKLDV